MSSKRQLQRNIKNKIINIRKEILESSKVEIQEQKCEKVDFQHEDNNPSNPAIYASDNEESDTEALNNEYVFQSDAEESDTEESDDIENSTFDLRVHLRQWAILYNIPLKALDALLRILHIFFYFLPLTGRTLVDSHVTSTTEKMGEGEFVYYGFERFLLTDQDSPARLQINIDGLPLFKSSRKEFWTILGSMDEKPPFTIGVYFGKGKPDVNMFLKKLIDDLHSNKNKIVLQSVICDVPAKSFVKCTKGHSGYSSCFDCTITGEYVNQVIFRTMDNPDRTDLSFRQKSDEDHHKGICPLERVNELDMVNAFPIDYMHCVCLGVMKRLLNFWLQGPLQTRFSGQMVSNISDKLCNLSHFISSDFNRKGRSLLDIKFWKATEYRSFLLYTGVIILRDTLYEFNYHAIYDNFLVLHSAIFILCNPDINEELISYANDLLRNFVINCGNIYGSKMLCPNVHYLIHLSKYSQFLGPLDKFSAFKFENHMQFIKRRIRSGNLPLQQFSNRLNEYESCLFNHASDDIKFRFPHCSGPMHNFSFHLKQFKSVCIKSISFSIFSKDCTIMTKNGSQTICYKILNVIEIDNKAHFVCKEYVQLESFYAHPLPSKMLNIFLAKKLSDTLTSVSYELVYCKMMSLPYKSDYVIFPLSHTYTRDLN